MDKLKNAEVIYCYSRREVIADGVLIDVSDMASEAGFPYPLAVTASVWANCVTASDCNYEQDKKGRLWDILNVLRFTIDKQGGQIPTLFEVTIQNEPKAFFKVMLKAICGPGDHGEPVLTIMHANED